MHTPSKNMIAEVGSKYNAVYHHNVTSIFGPTRWKLYERMKLPKKCWTHLRWSHGLEVLSATEEWLFCLGIVWMRPGMKRDWTTSSHMYICTLICYMFRRNEWSDCNERAQDVVILIYFPSFRKLWTSQSEDSFIKWDELRTKFVLHV